MKKTDLSVLMVGPVPPPNGGIGQWGLQVREYAKTCCNMDISTINTAPSARGIDGRSLFQRVVVQGLDMLKKSKMLRSALKSREYTAVHITTSGELAIIRDIVMLTIAKKFDIPSVYHIHFGRIPEIANRKTLEWKLLKKAIRIASHTIAIDRSTEKKLISELPTALISYVPNPFNMRRLDGICCKEQDKKYVIYVGWVVKTKGIEELLAAWNEVTDLFPDYTLQIVGPYKTEYYDYLISKYHMEKVEFSGEQPSNRTLSLMKGADIVVLPSYTEGFPNVILEAMALEKAIIATKVGAIPDMIGDNCGQLIEPYSVTQLSNALIELLKDSDQREKMGKMACGRLREQFEIEKVFPQYAAIWEEPGK